MHYINFDTYLCGLFLFSRHIVYRTPRAALTFYLYVNVMQFLLHISHVYGSRNIIIGLCSFLFFRRVLVSVLMGFE